MGIREDQIFGLNAWAQKLVGGEKVLLYTEEVVRVYPDGRRETQEPRQVLGSTVAREPSGEHYSGMCEGYPLYKYTFPDGRVYVEAVQSIEYSSGPCIFLALRNEAGNWIPKSLWPRAYMQAA